MISAPRQSGFFSRGFMESMRPIRALMRGLDALIVLNLREAATVGRASALGAF
jgi:hypothetical protein